MHSYLVLVVEFGELDNLLLLPHPLRPQGLTRDLLNIPGSLINPKLRTEGLVSDILNIPDPLIGP